MAMKRIILFMAAVMIAASCEVSDADFDNPTTDDFMKDYCNELFVDKVSRNLQYFYNAYYIGRFISGDAQLKVSPEYDIIRIGLSGESGNYGFGNDTYDFNGEDFFSNKGVCSVKASYWRSIAITALAEGKWAMVVDDGTVLEFTVKDETEDGIVLNMNIDGLVTDSNEYSVRFTAEDMEVDIRHNKIGRIASKSISGMMDVNFLRSEKPLKTCSMTFESDGSISCTIIDHMAD